MAVHAEVAQDVAEQATISEDPVQWHEQKTLLFVVPGLDPGLSGSDAGEKPERHAFRPFQPIGNDRDPSLVNRFFTLLGHRPIMPQAMVGIRPPAENLGRRTDSQDLMDHAQDIRTRLRER
jgi:hypothetical protein